MTVSDAGWKSAKGIDHMVLKVFFAGAKPDENGDRSRTFDELQHYVKQHATPVGDKLEDYQTPLRASWPIASTLPRTALSQWCFAWFLVF